MVQELCCARMHRMLRIVFMGSPDFAVPTLRALTHEYEIVGVITQPDRPAGRGRTPRPPAVKVVASSLGLAVLQPTRLAEPEAFRQLREWGPDLIVVTAFGQLLQSEVLDLPRHGCLNVHASLLPRWRGAAPIQAAIAAGDVVTGVTIMKMDAGLDTGGIIVQRRIPIEPQDTGGSLAARLSQLGAETLVASVPGYVSGELQPQLQDAARATRAPLLKKTDGLLDPSLSAEVLERRVRAFDPWPGTYILFEGAALKVLQAHGSSQTALPGSRLVIDGQPAVAAAEGALVLDKVQPAGKKPMDSRAFLLGKRNWASQK